MISFLFKSRILRQYLAGFSCATSVIILGTAIGWSSPAITQLRKEDSQVPITDSGIAWMVSMMYLANTLSPIPTGYLMDRFGRKSTTLYLSIFPILSWFALLYATEPYDLYIGRFLCGIYFGVVYTVVPIYLAEISEPHIRGALGNAISIMTYGGAFFVYSIGPYVDYRTLIYACLTVPVIFVMTFIWMPESPYYLLMREKCDKAKQSLTWLRIDKPENSIAKELEIIENNTREQMKLSGKFSDLISTRGNRKALIIVAVLAISQRLSGVGALMAYSSITIPKDSFPGLRLPELITILGGVWFLSSVVSTLLIDRLGRKLLLVVSTLGCGISTSLSSVWFYLHAKTDTDVSEFTWIPYTCFLFHALFYSLGIGPIGSAIKGELFPANIKGKASAVTTIILAATSFVLNKCYLTIADSYGMYLNFVIFSVTCFLTVIFTIVYVIETKGKTLFEILDELNGVKPHEKIVQHTTGVLP